MLGFSFCKQILIHYYLFPGKVLQSSVNVKNPRRIFWWHPRRWRTGEGWEEPPRAPPCLVSLACPRRGRLLIGTGGRHAASGVGPLWWVGCLQVARGWGGGCNLVVIVESGWLAGWLGWLVGWLAGWLARPAGSAGGRLARPGRDWGGVKRRNVTWRNVTWRDVT